MCHLFAHDFNCKRRSVGPRVSTSRFQVNIDSSKSKLRPIYKSMPVPTTKMRLYRQQQQQQSCWQHSTHTHTTHTHTHSAHSEGIAVVWIFENMADHVAACAIKEATAAAEPMNDI